VLKRAGQAVGRHCFSLAHLIAEVAIGVLVLAVVAIGALALRLSHGPLMIDGLVRPAIASLNREGPTQVRIGHAVLAWRGWQTSDAPVQLRVQDLEVFENASGRETELARLPDAAISLSLARLLIGQIRPRSLTLDSPAIRVNHAKDGSFTIDLGSLVAPNADNTSMAELVALGLLGTSADLAKPAAFLAELGAIRIRGARIAISDQLLGSNWNVAGADLEFLRKSGIWHGRANLPLRAGNSSLALAVAAEVQPGGATSVRLSISAPTPGDLAAEVPAFKPLAALRAPLTLAVVADLTPDLAPSDWRLDATLGAGSIAVADGLLPLGGGAVSLSGTGDQTKITNLVIDIPAHHGADISHLTGGGDFTRDQSGIRGAVSLDLAKVSFSDLPELWPFGIAPGARDWVTTHISGGTAQNVHVDLSINAQSDFSDATLTNATGQLTGDDLTLAWMLNVPGITHGHVSLKLLDKNDIAITIHDADQGPMAVTGGTWVMNGLGTPAARGTLAVDVNGQIRDLLTLLSVPALHLLSKHPVTFTSPSGAFTGHLDLGTPLQAHVDLDEISVSATLTGTGIHLGRVAAKHDLDRADLVLTVNNDGLAATGHGDIALVPGDISYNIDFRPGAIDQVDERATFQAIATSAQIAAAGYDPLGLLGQGKVGLAVTYDQTRAGAGTATIDADLGGVSLAPQMGWSKPIGTAGHATGTLLIQSGVLAAVPNFTANAAGMAVSGSMTITSGQIAGVTLHRLELGRSDLAAAVVFPANPGDPYQVHVSGAAIDLSSELKHSENDDAPDHGPHYLLDGSFDRGLMANGEELDHIAVRAESDHGVVRQAQVSIGAQQQTTLDIAPAINGRILRVQSSDAGALLLATNTLPDIRGGALTLIARYDDTEPHHPLSGTATITKFRMSDAPAITKLLQGLTGYGLFALAQGPGLAITTMQTSFQYQQNLLQLKNAVAHSASIGFTATGNYNLATSQMYFHGTIVPAYLFNDALSHLPLVGRMFSPEQGGGVLAATFSITGTHANPTVKVNPLAALTPGFLRGIFGGAT